MSRYKEPEYAIRSGRRRKKSPHPYAAIEHRVIDSPAFCDLKHSSVRLLLILARQLSQFGNNGHLQATWSYCRDLGIGSEGTLRRAIGDLISHQLIHRTRSSGTHKQWAKYAVTWLPITDSKDLYLHAWVHDAWKSWRPRKKSTPSDVTEMPRQNGRDHNQSPVEMHGGCPPKNDDYELVPSRSLSVSDSRPDLNRGESD